jgi:hypothetical protein
MKKALFTFIVASICCIVNAQNHPKAISDNLPANQLRRPGKIDLNDTVIFNMSKAVINGGFIDIPVTIKADDDIVALDFALLFDEQHLKYNSIINYTGYIVHNEFLNPSDSKLRMTSYSLNRYDKDTLKLVSLRFEMLSQKPVCTDLFMIDVWLNGDPCSYKLICPDGSVMVANANLNSDHFVSIYPNPAKQHITIEAPENGTVEIDDLNGNIIHHQTAIYANQKQDINIQDFTNGMYLLKIFNKHSITTKKLIINQ